jgi:hypothetical protein
VAGGGGGRSLKAFAHCRRWARAGRARPPLAGSEHTLSTRPLPAMREMTCLVSQGQTTRTWWQSPASARPRRRSTPPAGTACRRSVPRTTYAPQPPTPRNSASSVSRGPRRLILRLPGHLGTQRTKHRVGRVVPLAAQVGGVEIGHVDIAGLARVEAPKPSTPDQVTNSAGTDPRVGQPTLAHGGEDFEEPPRAADDRHQLLLLAAAHPIGLSFPGTGSRRVSSGSMVE